MTTPPPSGDAQYTPPPWNGAAGSAPDPAAYPIGSYSGQAPQTSPPGHGLSIAGLVLAFVMAPLGLILSIVAAVKLGRAGAPKGLAVAGIIVGAVITVLGILAIVLMVTLFAGVIGTCAELGPGVWQVDGVTYTCG